MSRTFNLVTAFATTLALVGCEAQPGAGAGATDEVAGLGVAREAAVSAPSANVKVINTAAEPVPTLAQGTTNVAGTVAATQSGPWSVGITGTPSVSAEQSGVWSVDAHQVGPWTVTAEQGAGPWSVSLAGTPTVALAPGTTVALGGTANVAVTNTPTVNIGNLPSVNIGNTPSVNVGNTPDVKITNDAANPLPVRNTEGRDRQPFQSEVSITVNAGEIARAGNISVPPGKRLVIEHFSVQAQIPSGGSAFATILTGSTRHVFPMTNMGPFGGSPIDVWLGSHPLVMFSDGGPSILAVRGPAPYSGIAFFDGTISGYLVDL